VDPASEFAANTHGVNVVLARVEDLAQFERGAGATHVEENVAHLVEALRAASSHMRAPLVFCLCPSPLEEQYGSAVRTALAGEAGVHVLENAVVDAQYPVENRFDPEGDRIGKIPYSEAYYCALGTALVRRVHALVRSPFKVIALDCDNTLWQGICGEDGPEGVVLDVPHRELHDFMLAQRSAGMLLTLASKNNESDVLETFRVHPEMPLQPQHFVTWRLNWDSKAENLGDISAQLGLGLDSFVFVDDNPKECAEVEQAVPAVVTIPLPLEADRTLHFLRHVWAFDHAVVTAEDRKRSAYYEQAAQFGNEIRSARSLEEFMASLKLRVEMSPLRRETLARAAQLTQRTNQFNLTTIRRGEAELEHLLTSGYECHTARVWDRFGDYGIVGLLVVKPENGVFHIDTMLLSCRVLGRGVEHKVLAHAAKLALNRGHDVVSIPYQRTERNQPAREFLEGLEGVACEETADGFVLTADAEALARVKWKATATRAAAGPTGATAQVHRAIDYADVARRLSTVTDILDAMRRESRASTLDETMSPVEQKLAGIWSDLLEKPSISRSDNFFDLGGHSLVAVLLLLRVREAFGVELSIDDVYSGTLTLADLAARIEAAQLGEIDPEEYAALLAEIENLTDEEARELLAREDTGRRD
jgi:FkbH-like protein